MKKLVLGIFVSLNLCAMSSEPGDQGKPALTFALEKLFSAVGSCLVVTSPEVGPSKNEHLPDAQVKLHAYGTLPPCLVMHNPSQDKESIQTAFVKDTASQQGFRVQETQDEILFFFRAEEDITQ